jgi:hypothetical protein
MIPPNRRAGEAARRLRFSIRHGLGVLFQGGDAPFRYRKRRPVSTTLVPAVVNVSSEAPDMVAVRPRADFLAQLIATAVQMPQTRLRRRAEPADAVAVYGAAEQRELAHRPTLLRSL